MNTLLHIERNSNFFGDGAVTVSAIFTPLSMPMTHDISYRKIRPMGRCLAGEDMGLLALGNRISNLAQDLNGTLCRAEARTPSIRSQSFLALAKEAAEAVKKRNRPTASWSRRVAREMTDAAD